MSITIHARLAVLLATTTSSAVLAQTQNLVVGTGFSQTYLAVPSVAPGEILTLFTTALNVPDAAATQIPLPTSLSGVSVLARVIGAADTTGYPTSLPILRVYTQNLLQMPDGVWCPTNPNSFICSSTQITVEIPTEGVCVQSPAEGWTCPTPPFTDLPPLLVLNVRANGATGPDLPLQVENFAPRHLLNSCDSIFGPQGSSPCQPVVTHADGTFVSKYSPARVGETIILYAVGLGFPAPIYAPPTGYGPSRPLQLPASYGTVVFTYPYPLAAGSTSAAATVSAMTNTTVQPDWVGLISGYVGLYQINATVPAIPGQAQPCLAYGTSPYGNAQVTLSPPSTDTLYICVQP